jgi:hypothetical protein
MLRVTLPNGMTMNAGWSNISPCSTIAESLVRELGLTMYPIRRSRVDIVKGMIGGSLGGKKEQCFFCRELVIRNNNNSTVLRTTMSRCSVILRLAHYWY